MTQPATGLLSESERRTLAAVCDAFFPRMDATGADAPELFALSARDVGLAHAVEQAMAALSARQLRELRLFLRLLDVAPFMLIAAGTFRGVSSMDATARERALLALARSPLPVVRTGFQALKRLSGFLFYSVTPNDAPNPAWKTIAYATPERPPGDSLLRLTRISKDATLDADVCIIGSGAGGSVVAATLAAAGKRVVVLEAGAGDQAADFDQRELVGTERLYLDKGTAATKDLGVALLAGACLGGGTTVNWQTSLRTPDFIRDEWADRSGVGFFTSDVFTHALDSVCTRLHVGVAESTQNGQNAPLARGSAALDYRWTTIPRNARGCDLSQCSFCVFGCRVGGKQSTARTYLVDAQADDRTTIVPRCRADRVVSERGRAVGVDATAIDDATGARYAVRVNAPMVVAACGAIESPALLMRSGVAHRELGRNLFLHPTTAVVGRYEEMLHPWIGAPQTVLCDEFGRLRGNYGFRMETPAVHPGLMSLALPWYGARDHRTRMQDVGRASAFIVLTRDRSSGRVRVDGEGRAVAQYAMGQMERELMQTGITAAARIHWAAGAHTIQTLHTTDHTVTRSQRTRGSDIDAFCDAIVRAPVHGNRCGVFSAHQMGTCRIGTDSARSVCDENGEVRGTAGLYVADASLFPASSGVNPMITVMALASVIAEGIAGR